MHRELVDEALKIAAEYDREVAEDRLRDELGRQSRNLDVVRQVVEAAVLLRLRGLERVARERLATVERDLGLAERTRAAAYGLSGRRTSVAPRRVVAGLVVTALIGIGGFGAVYEVEAAGRTMAVRAFEDAYRHDPACLARIRAGAAAWIAASPHPNLVAAYSLQESEDELALVMERAAPPTLEQELAQHGRPAVEEALGWALDLCAAIRAAGIAPVEIRPSNVFLGPDRRARLSDVGLPPMAPGSVGVATTNVLRAFGEILEQLVFSGAETSFAPIVAGCFARPGEGFGGIAEVEAELEQLLSDGVAPPTPSEEAHAEEGEGEEESSPIGPWALVPPAKRPVAPLDTLEEVEAAIAENPSDVRLWKRRLELQREARALRRTLGIGEGARQRYDFVREAEAWLAFDDPEEALRFFDAALAEDPSRALSWEGRARALEALGRAEEAAQAWAEFERCGGRREG